MQHSLNLKHQLFHEFDNFIRNDKILRSIFDFLAKFQLVEFVCDSSHCLNYVIGTNLVLDFGKEIKIFFATI